MEATLTYQHREPSTPHCSPAEIDAFLHQSIELGTLANFMNNFSFNLPNGIYREVISDMDALERPIQPGLIIDDQEATYGQLFADIDAAIAEIPSIELSMIHTFQERRRAGEQVQTELNQLILPLYRELLIKGYPLEALGQ